MEPWQKLPLERLRESVERERMVGHHQRPVYTWFRSFARRSGSLLRFLLIATLSDEDTAPDDILRFDETTGWEGKYVDTAPFENSETLLLDPMMGSGSTLVEGARIGVDTVGFDYNPVLWWVVKQTIQGTSDDIENEFFDFLEDARAELNSYVGGSGDETILAYLLALTVECPSCRKSLELHQDYELSNGNRGESYYLCPNTDCQSRVVAADDHDSEEVVCNDCLTSFAPNNGNFSYGTFYCSCGYAEELGDYFGDKDRTPSFSRYAVYCRGEEDGRCYRSLDRADREAIKRAEQQYREEDLKVPTSKIESGATTRQILQYNFRNYQELFTERQRFVLAKLFQMAAQKPSPEISDQLVTIIASTLRYNSVLTSWDERNDRIRGAFEINDQRVQIETVEVNPLAESWQPSIEAAYERFAAAKSYLEAPYETLRTSSGEFTEVHLSGESINEGQIELLDPSSAERIDMPPQSVDCAFLDPPYYDSVQSGELLDFYYVWLREILGDYYSAFSTTHVPKLREIAVNRERGKDEDYYYRALKSALEELHRILKTEGDLILLFRIKQGEVWQEIRALLIRSGFQIRGALPYDSNSSGDHPQHSSTNYGAAVFLKKKEEVSSIEFETVRQNLLYDIDDFADEERKYQPSLSESELQLVLQARGLAEFSKHYPHVYEESETVDARRGIQMVDDVLSKRI